MKLHLLLAALLLSLNCAAQERVERWGRFELTLHATPGNNPFDTELTATFTGPDTTCTVRGFYDGNDIFRVRFMPTAEGEWKYTTHSPLPALNDAKGHFTCIPPTEGNHGPVRVDGQYAFRHADGTRYYPMGTTAYNWMHEPDSLIARTVQSLREARFNKLRMLFFVQNFDPAHPEPTLFPYEVKSVRTDADGKRVYEWDYDRFNPAYFTHVEECIDRLAAIGVEADLILFHPYDEGRWGFDRMPVEARHRFLRYAVARLAAFRNVWWSLANEYDFMRTLTVDDWNGFARTVVENDPYRHLCSIHSHTAKYYAYWMPEFTHASVQDQAPVEGFGRAATVRNIYKKPVVFDEVCYEGNMDNRWGSLSGQEFLYRMWQGLVAGTYVGHGECYMVDGPNDYSRDFLAVGGTFQGTSWRRIGFALDILNAMPHPLQLADSSWDTQTSTAGDGYYLIYLGKEVPDAWTFELPVKNAGYGRLREGMRFRVEVIDTWNMTVTPCPVTFETGVPVRDRIFDRLHRSVPLPSQPYLLLRITAAE